MMKLYALLTALMVVTTCYGQAGHPSIVKTQGSNRYANVCCAMQDKAGNLWFGTTGEGVYRFDGKAFVQVTVVDGLCDNTVGGMLEDRAGTIWLATDGGLCRYNPAGNQAFTNVKIPSDDPLFSQSNSPYSTPVHTILEDGSGNLWLGTGSGVYCYDGDSFIRFLPHEVVACLLQDKTGAIWVGSWTGWGAYRYDARRAQPCIERRCKHDLGMQQDSAAHNQVIASAFTNFTRQGGVSDGMISSIVEDRNGAILFATRDHGIYAYRPSAAFPRSVRHGKANPKSFTHFSARIGLSNNDVRCILQDRAGNYWIGTDGGGATEGNGLYRYDGKSITQFTTQDGLSNNDVFMLFEDKAGNIWVGTRDVGLCRYDGKSFTNFSAHITGR